MCLCCVVQYSKGECHEMISWFDGYFHPIWFGISIQRIFFPPKYKMHRPRLLMIWIPEQLFLTYCQTLLILLASNCTQRYPGCIISFYEDLAGFSILERTLWWKQCYGLFPWRPGRERAGYSGTSILETQMSLILSGLSDSILCKWARCLSPSGFSPGFELWHSYVSKCTSLCTLVAFYALLFWVAITFVFMYCISDHAWMKSFRLCEYLAIVGKIVVSGHFDPISSIHFLFVCGDFPHPANIAVLLCYSVLALKKLPGFFVA